MQIDPFLYVLSEDRSRKMICLHSYKWISSIILILFTLCLFKSSTASQVPHPLQEKNNQASDLSTLLASFEHFMLKYNKQYLSNDEYSYRFKVFEANHQVATRLTKAHTNTTQATFGVTKFSDLTDQEFLANYLSGRASGGASNVTAGLPPAALTTPGGGAPDKWDWRNKSVVTGVRNQNKCGGCWAFSTVETAESAYARAHGKLQQLSVQQTIDCAEDGNMGCEGGDVCQAARWMKQNRVALVPESVYPLTDEKEACRHVTSATSVTVSDFECLAFKDQEPSLLQHIWEAGPVAASVDATTWKTYLGGVLMHHCGTHTNHAVQLVGYDTTGEVPFYIVRNSWGADFGDDGYLYIAVGDNVCNVASHLVSLSVW